MSSESLSEWASDVESVSGSVQSQKEENSDSNYWYGIFTAVVVPWIAFAASSGLLVFAFHLRPILVCVTLALFLFVAAFVIYLEQTVFRTWKSTGFLVIFAVCCGVAGGTLLYGTYLKQVNSISSLRRYDNVLPSEPAAGRQDAGKIFFAHGSRADVFRSVGFKDKDTYCVAPISVDNDDSVVQYWAVGVNCCRAREDMWCDDVGSPGVRGALRVPQGPRFVAGATGQLAQDNFRKAIALAEIEYGLQSADDALFVTWHRNPDRLESDLWRFAMGAWTVELAVYALVAYVAAVFFNQCYKGLAPDGK
mmetsp:Transcript_42618/g.90223  ORF Transcript_42618/g.90223 Transcript_42618/m.90223 type:complete len:307 (+) Transcript_42618:86-1006(+)|eukprot:CAMPEP_0204258506 /NCGR_PEP_ID=MMETSP0468-20130131/5016_1 /ASSEMBLY_ACC=CAM_ASM_000383 /TAXON_ID=2969 /ORGANISM="Oxyrrhis marina" /LENGTH=306 /DNA_ID=CAMNT_0051232693 /DNA_START=67 /DNA_END=987 /DNA_ORIENTATION=-